MLRAEVNKSDGLAKSLNVNERNPINKCIDNLLLLLMMMLLLMLLLLMYHTQLVLQPRQIG